MKMPIKSKCWCFIASCLILFSPIASSAGVDFTTAVTQAKERASHIAMVNIISGVSVGGADVDCGIIYEGRVDESIKGSKSTSPITFFSHDGLTVDSQYIVFLEEKDPYSLPEGVVLSGKDKFKEKARYCKKTAKQGLPYLTTGSNPLLLKIVTLPGKATERWIEVDTLRFRVNQLTSRPKDIKHCQGDDESLKPEECVLVSRRTLVPVESLMDLLKDR